MLSPKNPPKRSFSLQEPDYQIPLPEGKFEYTQSWLHRVDYSLELIYDYAK